MPTCPKCGTSYSIWSKNLTTDLCADCHTAEKDERARQEAEEQSVKMVKGKRVSCPICGHDRFEKQNILLNTRGAAIMNVDWANKDAETCSCRSCGYILWFRNDPIPQ